MTERGKCTAIGALALVAVSASAQQIDPAQIRDAATEVHIQRYGPKNGTLDQQFAAAKLAWASATGPVLVVIDKPGTLAARVTLPSLWSLLNRATVTVNAGVDGAIGLTDHNQVSCSLGAGFVGDAVNTGTLMGGSGGFYDLLSGCLVQGFRQVVQVGSGTDSAGNVVAAHDVKIHGAHISGTGAYGVITVVGANGTVASDPSQPLRVDVFGNYIHDTQSSAIRYFETHTARVYGNVMNNIGGEGYCIFAGGNLPAVGGYAKPSGAMSDFTEHNNTCTNAFAGVFISGVTNFDIGSGSYVDGITDVGFDPEGSSYGTVHNARCGTAGNGCFTNFYGLWDVDFIGNKSPTGSISIRNSSLNPSYAQVIRIEGNDVASIGTEPTEDLTVRNNTAGHYSLGFTSRLKAEGNTCKATPTTANPIYCYELAAPFYGSPAVLFNNTALLDLSKMPMGVTPSPDSAMFNLSGGYFNAPTNFRLDSNTNALTAPFPRFANVTVAQPNAVPFNVLAVNNHRAGGTYKTSVAAGDVYNFSEPTYWDATEAFHVNIANSPVLSTDGTGGTCGSALTSPPAYVSVKVLNDDGTVTIRKVVTCP